MKRLAAWILSVLLAVIFLFAGGVKLLGVPGMVKEFADIGIGQWLRYVTGLLEVGSAIGLLIPKVRFWAALQITAIMVCATAVNIFVLHLPPLARATAILLTLALLVVWLCRPSR